MNTKFIASTLIALASVASFAAFANEYDAASQPERMITSTLSRAQVQADYLKAAKAGTLQAVGEGADFTVQTADSSLSRTDVKTETIQWVRAHGTAFSEL